LDRFCSLVEFYKRKQLRHPRHEDILFFCVCLRVDYKRWSENSSLEICCLGRRNKILVYHESEFILIAENDISLDLVINEQTTNANDVAALTDNFLIFLLLHNVNSILILFINFLLNY